ncbi:MAG TPA: hypothetical protein VEQ10_16580 [Vicinamibacteria bacterium]|nr:hypothetical protein [Vicinamibacteria bacterium]
MQSRFAVAFAVSLPLLAPALAQAGPPLICWPMSIGNAPSLPWGGGWHDTRPDYDGRGRLATDTLALLGSDTPVLVRMETLRRAAVYAASDDAAAGRLFQALRARLKAPGETRAQALSQFDLGYQAEAYRQALFTARYMGGGPQARGIEVAEDGYELVHRALTALRPDPALEYAAALVSLDPPTRRPLADKHYRIAAAQAAAGSDLARTLQAHARLWADQPARPAMATR